MKIDVGVVKTLLMIRLRPSNMVAATLVEVSLSHRVRVFALICRRGEESD